ncbi:cytochrome P450 [Coniochaeta sp. 2T2.1]|nr:cytochrome P450 [Coniochaeta sp. 2T2.1]
MQLFYHVFFAVGLLLVFKFVWTALRILVSPLRSVPGPFLARFTDGWYLWRVSRGQFEKDNLALHARYGPVVRYGPNRYSISDIEASRIIYGHGSRFPKSSWYSTWASPGAWSIFGDQSIHRHAQNRKLYQHTYSMTSLVTYEPFVDQASDLFLQRLNELANAGGAPIDMGHWFQCYAFDVIGLITYGRRLGFLDRGADIGGVMGALEDHLVYATLVGIYAKLHRYLFPVRNFLAGKKGAGRAYVLNFTKERVSEHQSKKDIHPTSTDDGSKLDTKTGEPFLTKFIDKHNQDPTVFTSAHIIVGLAANMVAGSDTTAISLSAILFYLLSEPKCLAKLRAEISSLKAQGRVSATASFRETQDMPYLQAVIKESLRMHPATGLPLERVVPDGGARICGRDFPKGSIVGINSWVEHRNKDIFGEDADVFNPDRWLSADQERVGLMNRHWMPFGLGSRTCIGRHISMLEISKLLPRLLDSFDFEIVQSSEGHGNTWKTCNFWFVKPSNFMLRITIR